MIKLALKNNKYDMMMMDDVLSVHIRVVSALKFLSGDK